MSNHSTMGASSSPDPMRFGRCPPTRCWPGPHRWSACTAARCARWRWRPPVHPPGGPGSRHRRRPGSACRGPPAVPAHADGQVVRDVEGGDRLLPPVLPPDGRGVLGGDALGERVGGHVPEVPRGPPHQRRLERVTGVVHVVSESAMPPTRDRDASPARRRSRGWRCRCSSSLPVAADVAA